MKYILSSFDGVSSCVEPFDGENCQTSCLNRLLDEMYLTHFTLDNEWNPLMNFEHSWIGINASDKLQEFIFSCHRQYWWIDMKSVFAMSGTNFKAFYSIPNEMVHLIDILISVNRMNIFPRAWESACECIWIMVVIHFVGTTWFSRTKWSKHHM